MHYKVLLWDSMVKSDRLLQNKPRFNAIHFVNAQLMLFFSLQRVYNIE